MGGLPARLDGALTVDLEDWRCALDPDPKADYRKRPRLDEEYLRSSTRRILKEIESHNSKATFFVLGEVASNVPEVVKEVARAGHEIASHSPVHLPPRMIPRAEFERLMKQDVDLLESIVGTRPIGFRAPYFALRRDEVWLFEILARLGFLYDSTVSATWTPYWGIPSAPKHPYYPDPTDIARQRPSGRILEIPLTVWPSWRLLPGLPIAGGFYMRAWPRPLLARFMKGNLRRGFPLVLYVHPGNLESEKERIDQPTARDRISQYAGAGRGPASFRYLLRTFRFGTVRDTFSSQLAQLQSKTI